ncbi:phosphate signaling complex protein PhoU [Kamptonema cortianum]|nr:phosphate signaling complex protein PhoU [Geitlerinema splendidum]MDK3155953.1 phosphate signaling complex protein PhoU [Kamptonema cortianum]
MEPIGAARKAYTAEKTELEQEVLEMVSRAESMFSRAVESLVNLDKSLAMQAIASDDEIDRQDIDIEQRCLRMLALQQPMGSDLREIGTVLKIITDIERIGDLSVDISKICLKIEAEMGSTDYVDLHRIATVARTMVIEGVQAFIRKDISGLQSVVTMEEVVDQLYRELRAQIHDYMRSHPEQVVAASWLLIAVHHIERVADHALNIAERVNFMVTGELRQLVRDQEDDEPT